MVIGVGLPDGCARRGGIGEGKAAVRCRWLGTVSTLRRILL